jgi:hypothetical protein
VLDNVELHKAGSRITCIVRLRRRDLLYRGEASELDSTNGLSRAAVRAALAAAAQSVDDVSFGLEGIAVADFFGRSYVVVSVEAARSRRFSILSGILALDAARSPEEAAALATLRAIDRWIAV